MSSFTISYSQPEEYRFSLDSVEAPLAVAHWCQSEDVPVSRVLDLCAGCGVMGLEFAHHFARPLQIDFVEVQDIYKTHFDLNTKQLLQKDQELKRDRKLQLNWLQLNYDGLIDRKFENVYDLVLCNPPYFRIEQGKLSPSDFKNRCRFFLDSSPERLWAGISHVLKPNGTAFVLLRDLHEHGWNQLKEVTQVLRYVAQVESWRDVRGTHLVKICKAK